MVTIPYDWQTKPCIIKWKTRLAKKSAKKIQEELRKYQIILQRLNLLTQETPKDQFNDDISQTDIDRHFNKAKTEFEKIFPPVK